MDPLELVVLVKKSEISQKKKKNLILLKKPPLKDLFRITKLINFRTKKLRLIRNYQFLKKFNKRTAAIIINKIIRKILLDHSKLAVIRTANLSKISIKAILKFKMQKGKRKLKKWMTFSINQVFNNNKK